MNMTAQEQVWVGKGDSDGVTERLTWNMNITRVCILVCYCSEHIISGGRRDTERDTDRQHSNGV